jgi:putative transposase
MLGHVSRQSHPLVRGALKQVFAAVDRDMAAQVATSVIAQLRGVAPKVARLLEDAEQDLLAYMGFPREHWPKIRSTNPLERVNPEIARRSDVVGIYPNDAALIRLAAGLLVEINDEWLVAHRYISHASLQLILPELEEEFGDQSRADQPVLQGALAGAAISTT